MPAPQNFKNHTRLDPIFHFVIIPILLLNLGFAIRTTIHAWPAHPHLNPWWIVMSIVFLLMAVKTRSNALMVQNRVIRLEERLRLATILPPSELPRIAALSPAQLIALRFAADEELTALALQAATQKLEAKAIKQSIVNWRPDHYRV
jgi:hypothetical protein